jgi:cysteine desulfurase
MKIYLDHNSTTPLHEEVAEFIAQSLAMYENPSGLYSGATHNRQKIDIARQQVAALLNADPDELIFTSGGTESNNTVLSLCHLLDISAANEKKKEVIVSAIEHHSVLNCAQNLEKYGIKVHYIPVGKSGRIDVNTYKAMLSDATAVISIMLANNELGTIQDIKRLAALAHESGAFFHTDTVQSMGKIPVSSGGAACNSGSVSHVLQTIGVDKKLLQATTIPKKK